METGEPITTPRTAAHQGAHVATAHLCADCGAPAQGPYCPQCGQRQDAALRSAPEVARAVVTELTDLDARFYRTLRTLVRTPGALTAEYLAGRRTRYVPPFRLYLAISVVYFAAFWATDSTRFFIFWASGTNPEVATLVRLLPKLMFLMLPLFAGYLAVAYPRRHAYEGHFVFALHYHAFAFLVLTGVSLLQPVVRNVRDGSHLDAVTASAIAVSSLVEFWVMIYLFLALRRVHRESRTRTAIKAALVFLAHMTAIAAVGVLALPTARAALLGAMGLEP